MTHDTEINPAIETVRTIMRKIRSEETVTRAVFVAVLGGLATALAIRILDDRLG